MKNEYLSYQAEELAQEVEFIHWVKSTDPALAERWTQWLNQHPEEATKVATAKALVQAVQWEVPELNEDRKQAIWQVIDAATTENKSATIFVNKAWRPWAVAASIVLLFGIAWWLFLPANQAPILVQTDRAEVLEHVLPDGSEVSINAASRITYEAASWKNTRTLSLEGEAFFSVEKGQPFIVKTALGKVEVLGTSFNVEVRDDVFRVNCYSGSVQVSNLNGDRIILLPQEGVQLVNDQLIGKALSNTNDIAWQEQTHHFVATPLAEVFSELERQYPITVNYPAELRERAYTGFFKNNDLEQALQAICWPMQLTFLIDQQQVTIQPQ